MEIVFEQYKAKKHNDYFWELFEYKAVVPRGMHHDPDAEPVEKWCSLGRYPSTMALAMEDIYELAVKNSPGVYELKDAIAAAKRIERGIERVVRCRDCKYAMEHRSKSILGTELVTLTCSGPIQGAYSEGADVEPDDFCAWGRKRES